MRDFYSLKSASYVRTRSASLALLSHLLLFFFIHSSYNASKWLLNVISLLFFPTFTPTTRALASTHQVPSMPAHSLQLFFTSMCTCVPHLSNEQLLALHRVVARKIQSRPSQNRFLSLRSSQRFFANILPCLSQGFIPWNVTFGWVAAFSCTVSNMCIKPGLGWAGKEKIQRRTTHWFGKRIQINSRVSVLLCTNCTCSM